MNGYKASLYQEQKVGGRKCSPIFTQGRAFPPWCCVTPFLLETKEDQLHRLYARMLLGRHWEALPAQGWPGKLRKMLEKCGNSGKVKGGQGDHCANFHHSRAGQKTRYCGHLLTRLCTFRHSGACLPPKTIYMKGSEQTQQNDRVQYSLEPSWNTQL